MPFSSLDLLKWSQTWLPFSIDEFELELSSIYLLTSSIDNFSDNSSTNSSSTSCRLRFSTIISQEKKKTEFWWNILLLKNKFVSKKLNEKKNCKKKQESNISNLFFF